MPTTWPWLFDPERVKLAPPLAWAIALAAIMSVFAVVAIIVNYAPLNRDRERRIEIELPPPTFETVAALIKATGNTCSRVCAIAPMSALGSSSTLDVACAAPTDKSCAITMHYRINVEAATVPQR